MPAYPDIGLYIGGAWRKTRDTLPALNPATEQVLGTVPVATRADLDDALAAAAEGFRVWSRTPPARRAEVMLKAAALMRERIDAIGHTITVEHGKPYEAGRLEVIRGCEFFEWDAGEAVRCYGRVIPSAQGIRYIVHHQPIGTVAAFSPWNFPMSQPARKVAGAIASGCSIILKAAEETPGVAFDRGLLRHVGERLDHRARRQHSDEVRVLRHEPGLLRAFAGAERDDPLRALA